MSINSLTNAAAARRPDMVPIGEVPDGLNGIARACATWPATDESTARGSATGGSAQVNTALQLLFGYMPTEIVTLYVAVLAALGAPSGTSATSWPAYWIFLVATPVVVWLAFAAKIKAAGKPVPLSPAGWPKWEMVAATIAFVAWAFALPNNPFTGLSWYSSALAAVMVLVASTALGLLAPFFQRPLKTSEG
jgi:hypothetical protein